jgi:hypothetical protein
LTRVSTFGASFYTSNNALPLRFVRPSHLPAEVHLLQLTHGFHTPVFLA